MTTALALEYIPRRMEELGYGKNYYIRFRHLTLQAGELLELEAYNQFYILVEDPPVSISVISDFGMYDLSFGKTNEQSYEHQGVIYINNYSTTTNHLRFIQVIPKHLKTEEKK
jgi:hypothetical protein